MKPLYRNTYNCRLRWLAETPPDRAMPYKQREHRGSHVLDGRGVPGVDLIGRRVLNYGNLGLK